MQQVRELIEKKRQAFYRVLIMRFKLVGEQFIINARTMGEYKDRTKNLRGSIAYVVLLNGVPQGKQQSSRGGEGAAKAQAIINEVSAKYPHGLVLVCIAGMEYAAYVEAKGYDVITGSGIIAAKALKRAIYEVTVKFSSRK